MAAFPMFRMKEITTAMKEAKRNQRREYEKKLMQASREMVLPERLMLVESSSLSSFADFGSLTNIKEPPKPVSPEQTLKLIKKSVKQLKTDIISEKGIGNMTAKINRLRTVGALAQATILDAELQLRVKLMRLQEWNYKVLPREAIEKYKVTGRGWDGNGGRFQVHIDPLEKYCGVLEHETSPDVKDKIIPDAVLDKLEEANKQQVFDEVSVLWVEKVKDPLLLGQIKGCEDYFLIAEWGNDVKFDDIVKGKS